MGSNGETPKEDSRLLQGDSSGVQFTRESDDYKMCYYADGYVDGKDEKYWFPCDKDLECCGNECCNPEAPLWLWILLILLLLLLLCICCGLVAWIWYKCRPKKEKFVASPMEVTFVPAAKSQPATLHREDEFSRHQKIYVGNHVQADVQQAQMAYYRSGTDDVPSYNLPFEPSPMSETHIPQGHRLKAHKHDVAEISAAQPVSVSHVKVPDGQQAQQVYIRPAFDNVPAYN